MFFDCEFVEQSIELWAVANVCSDFTQLSFDVESSNKSVSWSLLDLSTQYFKSCGFACAVDSQESKHVSLRNCEWDIFDRNLVLIFIEQVHFAEVPDHHCFSINISLLGFKFLFFNIPVEFDLLFRDSLLLLLEVGV